jgi:hypothetical protein
VYVRSRVANSVRLEDADGVRYRVGCELLERMGPKKSDQSSVMSDQSSVISDQSLKFKL